MADEYQVIYEYSAGLTISFKTNNLKITYIRPYMRIDVRVDGTKVVMDPGFSQRIFSFTARISGNDMYTLNTVQTAAITYTGLYPRIQKIYYDGDSTESNIEIAITSLEAVDTGAGWWNVAVTMTEKVQ